MNELSAEQVVVKVYDLPPLPAIVTSLLEGIARDDVSLDAIADMLGQDQALAAKVLRLANSSFYGLQRQVTTVNAAVAILGFRSVRTLVTAAAVASHFTAPEGGSFDIDSFWRHSMATALGARALAGEIGVGEDNAFTAGLLHDIGRLVLVTRFPREYQAVIAYHKANDCHLLKAEDSVLGINHTIVGHALAKHWKFAPAIQEAISDHHAPGACDPISLAGVVHVADALSYALDLSGDSNDLVPTISDFAWSTLNIAPPRWMRIMRETESQFEDIRQALAA